ncbi:hypothetical protein GDO78_022017 [Eleutherodactylus coqui]|uniref:Uncharacterized protein n=1 Tax=Eleutherodactylus coqui TaxID=57060 RepID=A0A8J6E2Q7_ELECQ|nr:hypothetical protein GDO78_022017 [Eleutherodactylus coqui]
MASVASAPQLWASNMKVVGLRVKTQHSRMYPHRRLAPRVSKATSTESRSGPGLQRVRRASSRGSSDQGQKGRAAARRVSAPQMA